MNASGPCTSGDLRLGFLTYIQLPVLGLVGGLLLVDHRARPIEFHCSAPIQTSRTQEILYGKTLAPTLYCDKIGKSLLEQLSCRPRLIFTDEPLALTMRSLVDLPLALLFAAERCPQNGLHADRENWTYESDGLKITIARDSVSDRRVVRDTVRELTPDWDLSEPLDRIRQAVTEAHRAAA